MSGAGYILAINLSVAGLLAAAFMTIALYDRRQMAARWFVLAYFFGMANGAIEIGIAVVGSNLAIFLLSFAAILGAMTALVIGLAGKYRVPVPWSLLGTIFVGSLVLCAATQNMPRDSVLRMLFYQTPFFLLQAIAAWVVWRAPMRRRGDRALAVLLGVSALQFLAKPALMQLTGGTGTDPHTYASTNYALVSQSMGAIFAVAIALGILTALVRDLLSEVTVKSETDPLSGLLNRAGFERRAGEAIVRARLQTLPVALAIADLDHFKRVNDTYGHKAGDQVIRVFAALLAEAAGDEAVIARLGGEEFVVVLPSTGLVSARLFAEGIRTGLAARAIDGLPEGEHVTVSFGVAVIEPHESLSSLMHRADKALYAAKESGRDQVRTAPPDLAPLPEPAQPLGRGRSGTA